MNNKRSAKTIEKPNNFKAAIIRLVKSLKDFRILIILSLILAIASSILSLVTPNRLSDLTDEISKGLVVNSKKLKEITMDISEDLSKEKLTIKMKEIMESTDISNQDKISLQMIMTKLSVEEDEKAKLQLLKELPSNIKIILFPATIYDKTTVTSEEKITFLLTMSNLNENSTSKEMYDVIDKLPASIKTIIEPKMNINKIKDIAIFLAIIYFTSALFSYIESISMTSVSNKLRSNISTKINKLPLNYFDRHETGDILSRVTNDVDTIAQSMNQSLATLVSSITLLIGSIIMMFITNGIMAITAILASLIGFVFVAIILSKSQKYFIARQVELGKLNGHIEEIYSGLNVVKAYNGKYEADKEFDKLNDKVYECNRKSQFLSGLMMPLMNFIGNFGYVAVCVIGALLVANGTITFGVIVAFIVYVRLFTSPLTQIAQAMTSLQSTAAASERVFDFLDEKEMPNQENQIKFLDKDKVEGQIDFSHVKFGYDPNKIIIKDFNASIKPKSKIAIVGPTGAGKTTMVNLLMKFYEINSGDIKIDGISIKDLKRENVHDLFTMVLQDTWLFNGTIKENIVYNCTNISDKKIKDVCQLVGVDHFIKTLPEGYNSILGDNNSISSGQRQLLTIARGMLKNAPFLILDEATSNVDTRTEELVQKAMDKLMEGKTSFIIAHRLSTIKNADLILVMNEGNIIENGTHKELMKKQGFYAELYNSQFKKINS